MEELSYRERAKRKKLQNESFSLWMDMLYRLSLANHVSASIITVGVCILVLT